MSRIEAGGMNQLLNKEHRHTTEEQRLGGIGREQLETQHLYYVQLNEKVS